MKWFIPFWIFLAFLSAGCNQPPTHTDNVDQSLVSGDAVIRRAFETHATGLMVEASGRVERVLSDDNEGSRHQRFILRLDSGQTLLVSHNIDLAPRLEGMIAGDAVTFRGQYEYNEKGGVIHWTHRDPDRLHPGGWILYRGRRYQ